MSFRSRAAATVVAACLAAACGTENASGADPAVSGRRVFAVAGCVSPTIDLRFTADARPVALRSKEIAVKTPAGRPGTVEWTVQWTTPRSTNSAIKEFGATGTLTTTECPRPGDYEITVALLTDPGTPGMKDISITLLVAEPGIDAPATITWAVERWSPLGGRPLVLPLRETSHLVSVPDLSIAGGALRNQGGELTDVLVTVEPPKSVSAGGEAQARVTLSDHPPPGTYTAKLSIHSLSLRQERTVEATVKVRIWWGILLLTVFAGVALGWVVNYFLKERADRAKARLDALQKVGAIATRAARQLDPFVRQRLLTIAAEGEAAVLDAARADLIAEAAKAATDMAAKVEADAATAATALRDRLRSARGALRPGQRPLDPLLAPPLADVGRNLDEAERLANLGRIEEATRALATHEAALPEAVVMALRPWLTTLRDRLDEFGRWSDVLQEPEKSRLALLATVRAAYSAADPAVAIAGADEAVRDLRGWWVLTAQPNAGAVLGETVDVLRSGNRADLADAVLRARDDLMRPGGGADPLAGLAGASAARRNVEQLLMDNAPSPGALRTLLKEGRFPDAAAQVAPAVAPAFSPAFKLLGPAATTPIDRDPTALEDSPITTAAWIELPPVSEVGRAAVVRLVGGPGSGTTIEWRVDPEAADIRGASDKAEIVAKRDGFILIQAWAGGRMIAEAQLLAGKIIESKNYSRIARYLDEYAYALWLATAILTTLIGYLIFQPNWFGTLSDFVSAFLWGFLGQFGLDRVREVAKPVISKTFGG